jgi:hypothetical protein
VWMCCAVAPALADEGMWPFNQFPREAVAQKRQFDATPEFLDKLRLAAVRLPGGSGAFVSPEGLLVTNQHLVAGCLGKLVPSGFQAASREAEIACPGMDAAVLTSIGDVTAKVKAAGETVERRNAAINRLEKDCAAAGGRCTVVRLFSGGRYDLYRYRVYTDLRLVFAPESDLAFFGREKDSVTYLRYGLDVAFLRAYENGKPAATPHYLKWSAEGAKEGDLVFAAGNPEPAMRSSTAAQLTFSRDTALPFTLVRMQPRIRLLREFAAKSEANLQAAGPALSGFITTYKVAAGKYVGLRDDRLVGRKTVFESKIRRAVERDPKLGAEAGKVWDEVAAAYKAWAPSERPYQLLEAAPAPGSTLFAWARLVVRLSAERAKPDAERLPGYRDRALAALEKSLGAAVTVNDGMEAILIGVYLEELRRYVEKEVPLKSVLGGKNAEQVAEAVVKSTKLKDPAARLKLAASQEDFRHSDDLVLRLAALIDASGRKVREKRAVTIEALEATAADKIAGYRFLLFGAADYPDATATPRVEFGLVKGYTDRAGVAAPFAATFGGLYYRRQNEGPYRVPQRWVDAKAGLDLFTPLDFVSTCDVGGGDAGSPVVNRAGELVGVTFDGNIESLPGIYLYSDEQARAVHVAVQGIAEALAKVYRATGLLAELGVGR